MKKNNKKGFTLVELVIVVAVMAVLVAVAIPTVGSITGTAKKAVQDSNARTIESVIKLAEADASKNGDDVVELSEQQVWNALTDAKLGIEEGSFTYDLEAGTVKTTVTGTNGDKAGAKLYIITFGATAADKTVTPITVTGDATVTGPAVTP